MKILEGRRSVCRLERNGGGEMEKLKCPKKKLRAKMEIKKEKEKKEINSMNQYYPQLHRRAGWIEAAVDTTIILSTDSDPTLSVTQ